MNIERFHSSESLEGSVDPGRWRNWPSVGATISGFANPSSRSFGAIFAAASSSFGSIRSSTRMGSMKPA